LSIIRLLINKDGADGPDTSLNITAYVGCYFLGLSKQQHRIEYDGKFISFINFSHIIENLIK
jgi:hypothetical protein